METLEKIRLIPVAQSSEFEYLTSIVITYIGSAKETLDKWSAPYLHETPWEIGCLRDPRANLHRVQVGLVGRIKTCADAAMLGISSNVPIKSVHFTSMGLYYVCRIARQERMKLLQLKKMEIWLNSLFDSRCANSRFMETFNLETVDDAEEEN